MRCNASNLMLGLWYVVASALLAPSPGRLRRPADAPLYKLHRTRSPARFDMSSQAAGDDAAEASSAANAAVPAVPEISILLPVYNAMPWLPLAVLSCLNQEGVSVELVACDDGCTDGSGEFLLECAQLLQQRRGDIASAVGGTVPQKRAQKRASEDSAALAANRRRLNPALQLPTRALTASNAAALFIGGAAGDADAVATAEAALAAVATSTEGEEAPPTGGEGAAQGDAGAGGQAGGPVALTAAEVVERCAHCSSTLVVLHSGGRGQVRG